MLKAIGQVQAQHLLSVNCDLGEGPVWNPMEQSIYWADIEVGQIHRFLPVIRKHEVFRLGVSIGAFGFRKKGGLILATGQGFAFWNPKTDEFKFLYNPLANKPNLRMNDGKVDSSGRFWAGSMDLSGNGALYCYYPDGSCHTVLENIKISNGLGWSPDDRNFYYTDSGNQVIYKFDFEKSSGQITNPQVFIQLPDDHSLGVPDGLTIDSEGFIWSARWDGGKVVRYSPQGVPVLEVILPVSRVTSVTFGGEDLRDLIITTASTGLSIDQREEQPFAGDIFIYRSKVSGLGPSFFGG